MCNGPLAYGKAEVTVYRLNLLSCDINLKLHSFRQSADLAKIIQYEHKPPIS
jgi:hypothetical protein